VLLHLNASAVAALGGEWGKPKRGPSWSWQAVPAAPVGESVDAAATISAAPAAALLNASAVYSWLNSTVLRSAIRLWNSGNLPITISAASLVRFVHCPVPVADSSSSSSARPVVPQFAEQANFAPAGSTSADYGKSYWSLGASFCSSTFDVGDFSPEADEHDHRCESEGECSKSSADVAPVSLEDVCLSALAALGGRLRGQHGRVVVGLAATLCDEVADAATEEYRQVDVSVAEDHLRAAVVDGFGVQRVCESLPLTLDPGQGRSIQLTYSVAHALASSTLWQHRELVLVTSAVRFDVRMHLL